LVEICLKLTICLSDYQFYYSIAAWNRRHTQYLFSFLELKLYLTPTNKLAIFIFFNFNLQNLRICRIVMPTIDPYRFDVRVGELQVNQTDSNVLRKTLSTDPKLLNLRGDTLDRADSRLAGGCASISLEEEWLRIVAPRSERAIFARLMNCRKSYLYKFN
jgi:hypothetical protein